MSCITKKSSKQPTTKMSYTNQTEPKMFSTDQDGVHARVPNDFAKQMSFKFCQKWVTTKKPNDITDVTTCTSKAHKQQHQKWVAGLTLMDQKILTGSVQTY